MHAHAYTMTDTELRAACGTGRMSAQRLHVARAASRMHGAFTVEELCEEARVQAPGLGAATAYRAVAALTGCGTLAVIGERDGRALYVWCANGEHHHHVICTGCGRVAGVDCPLPEGDAIASATDAGFTVTRHDLTLYGVCDVCREGGDV